MIVNGELYANGVADTRCLEHVHWAAPRIESPGDEETRFRIDREFTV